MRQTQVHKFFAAVAIICSKKPKKKYLHGVISFPNVRLFYTETIMYVTQRR